jgi:hypothetical protein
MIFELNPQDEKPQGGKRLKNRPLSLTLSLGERILDDFLYIRRHQFNKTNLFTYSPNHLFTFQSLPFRDTINL